MRALTAASRDIIRDTKAAIAPRKNDGATAFEKICVSLSMSGTNSMLQLLHLRLRLKPRFLRVLVSLRSAGRRLVNPAARSDNNSARGDYDGTRGDYDRCDNDRTCDAARPIHTGRTVDY